MTATTTRAAETWAHLTAARAAGHPLAVVKALDFAQDGYGDLAEACGAVEAVAQAHLDAHPDDHAARRLLGEWLTACGDERGEGLCALAACRKVPLFGYKKCFVWFNEVYYSQYTTPHVPEPPVHSLPGYWYDAVQQKPPSSVNWHDYDTRQAAESAAAFAFLRLPETRRLQLLRGEM